MNKLFLSNETVSIAVRDYLKFNIFFFFFFGGGGGGGGGGDLVSFNKYYSLNCL